MERLTDKQQSGRSLPEQYPYPRIQIQSYNDLPYLDLQIVQLHLALRHWQQQRGENDFHAIADSQDDLSDITANYLNDGGQFFIAQEGHLNSIVGFVGLKKIADRSGSLKRLAVMPEYQGRGIGYSLVGELTSWAMVQGYQTIRLATGSNERAQGIYKKHGFKVVGVDESRGDSLMELDFSSDPS